MQGGKAMAGAYAGDGMETGRVPEGVGETGQRYEEGDTERSENSDAEGALALLGRLPGGTLYLRLDAGPTTLRNVPVVLWRGESGMAAGEAALKLVFEDESSLSLSRVVGSEMDPDGRVAIHLAGATATFGLRPW